MNLRKLQSSEGKQCLTKSWDPVLCPDPDTCSTNCFVDGVDAKAFQGKLDTFDKGAKLSYPDAPRVYMLEGEDKYKMFFLKNRELAFDVDLSTLPCGMNAAVYLVEMSKDGGAQGS